MTQSNKSCEFHESSNDVESIDIMRRRYTKAVYRLVAAGRSK